MSSEIDVLPAERASQRALTTHTPGIDGDARCRSVGGSSDEVGVLVDPRGSRTGGRA